ncbi:hypothetical protein D3C72_1488020 [compost metagenome]
MLFDQRVATENFTQMVSIQRPFDDLFLPRTHFWRVAVANGFDQQILKRHVVEGLTKDVEHFTAQSLLFNLQLFEQLLEYFTFAGFVGNNVPQMADLILTNSVDTAETLLQTVGVPGQVVIDH